jgi:hypothetical protein
MTPDNWPDDCKDIARMFHELQSRDRGGGCATRSAGACAACRATTGFWTLGVPEWYVAGTNTRGRQEGRPYPRSQQAIHEISGLAHGFCRDLNHPIYELALTPRIKLNI